MRASRFPIIFLAGILLLASISCSLFGSTGSPPASPEETAPQISGETPEAGAPEPEVEPQPTQDVEQPYPSPSQEEDDSSATSGCSKPVCIESAPFPLARPIGEGGRYSIDTTTRYGSLNKKTGEMVHGVQFLNSTGTAVLAAADGVVVAASDDSKIAYGPGRNVYGNLIVLKHAIPGIAEPVYTLYAHLSELSVKVDDTVNTGQQIGLVGMTGSVAGSTLYFEVRAGENTYDAAVNPELWLALLPDEAGAGTGALSGSIIDAEGEYIGVSNILIEPVQKSVQALIKTVYLKTYLEKNARGLAPWQESFAAAGLPEGSYQISFYAGSELYQRVVEVQPGMLTSVTFDIK